MKFRRNERILAKTASHFRGILIEGRNKGAAVTKQRRTSQELGETFASLHVCQVKSRRRGARGINLLVSRPRNSSSPRIVLNSETSSGRVCTRVRGSKKMDVSWAFSLSLSLSFSPRLPHGLERGRGRGDARRRMHAAMLQRGRENSRDDIKRKRVNFDSEGTSFQSGRVQSFMVSAGRCPDDEWPM